MLSTYMTTNGSSQWFETLDAAGNRVPWFPFPQDSAPLSIAWDEDLKMLWAVSWGIDYNIYSIHPESHDTLAYGLVDFFPTSITFMYDTTPRQEPVLFVSGQCPGDLTITVADATPNEPVHLTWGARRGRSAVSMGACRGVRTGLASPRLGATLMADSWGLATTTLPVTSCQGLLVQALDEGLCEMTEVEAVVSVP